MRPVLEVGRSNEGQQCCGGEDMRSGNCDGSEINARTKSAVVTKFCSSEEAQERPVEMLSEGISESA